MQQRLDSFRREDVFFHIDGGEEIELRQKLGWTKDFEEVTLGTTARMVLLFAQGALFAIQISMAVVVDA